MERDYNQVFEIPNRSGHKKFLVIVIIILLIIIPIIYLVYNICTNKWFVDADVYIPSQTYYAVILMQDDIKSNLDSMYSVAKMAGASGYVWQEQNTYYLLALIYPNEDMAKSVVASNVVDDFQLDILCIDRVEIKYNLDDLKKEDIAKINEIETYIVDMASILYELTIAVHLDNISAIACAGTINNHKGDMMAYETWLDEMLQTFNHDNLNVLETRLVKLINIMDKMVNELITATDVDNVMKYNFCEYIFALCHN